jgi:hypothetical protein
MRAAEWRKRTATFYQLVRDDALPSDLRSRGAAHGGNLRRVSRLVIYPGSGTTFSSFI